MERGLTGHGKAERIWTSKDGSMTGGKRKKGFGRNPKDYAVMDPNATLTNFPLWTAGDFRHTGSGIFLTLAGPTEYDWEAGKKATGQIIEYTAYHFHNFFDDTSAIRRKVS